MNNTFPYYDDLGKNDGAFITPSNNILFTNGNHEEFAKSFCNDISNFSKKELNLYKLWLGVNKLYSLKTPADFLVLVLGYDKVEKINRKTITTTNTKPHIKFYNYYLMDWSINIQTSFIFNEQDYEFKSQELILIRDTEDKDAETEINEIRKLVPKRDRHIFFK